MLRGARRGTWRRDGAGVSPRPRVEVRSGAGGRELRGFLLLSPGKGLRLVAAPLCGPGGHGALPVLGSEGGSGCQESQQPGKGWDPANYFP